MSMNVKEVAELMGVAPATVRALAQDGQIPCKVIPRPRKRLFLFDREQVVEWWESGNEQDAVPENEPDEAALRRAIGA